MHYNPDKRVAASRRDGPADRPVEFAAARRPTPARSAAPRREGIYSRAELIDAIKRWVALYGEPPKMIDWEPARARRLGHTFRAERFEDGDWPSARMVTKRFSSFNAAVEAAGLRPRRAPSRTRPNLTGPQAIIDSLLEWTRRYGDIPTMADWDPTRARRLRQEWRIARYYQGDWPSARSVALHFGSFAEAAAAAGLVARPRGRPHDPRLQDRATNCRAAATASARGRSPGHTDLADRLRALSRARACEDPVAIHAALIDLAGSALAWAQIFGSD